VDDIRIYIEKELDEESREDFFRLKRVTDNKKIKKAEEFIEQEKRAAANLK
jgi:vacuolar-type H+-ATPase subunit D/Vma8